MTVVISMLRGINVGGHNKIAMEALRDLYESLGHLNVQTHIQSGNVVFRSKAREVVALAKRIENEIETRFGFRPSVIARTVSELKSAITRNPFAARRDIDPSKLLVMFLAAEPEPEAREKLLKIKANPEEFVLDGRELYVYFPNGMGRPKLSMAQLERAVRTPATGRNWNTVTKLLSMAEKMEEL